jgi:SPP1 gp7 family putative phage head morphogenesis protein
LVRRAFAKGDLFDPEAFQKTFELYSEQVRRGTGIDLAKISYTDPRFELYNNLQADAARFSAFREAQKQRELNAAKTDLDRQRITQKYKEFQLTEKQTIFAQSAAAKNWVGYKENEDIYPNLQWHTAGDSAVRPEHAALQGLTLSINDPFWKTHIPQLGFGCRCSLTQTDAKIVKKDGYKEVTVPAGFDFNPGIDQTLFSNNVGYYVNASNTEAKQLKEQATKFIRSKSRDFGSDNINSAVKNKIGEITINSSSRREWLNQPHIDYAVKNSLLENLDFLKNLKFSEAPAKNNPMVKHIWVAKIILMGKESVVIVREYIDGRKVLYSISDKPEKFREYLK